MLPGLSKPPPSFNILPLVSSTHPTTTTTLFVGAAAAANGRRGRPPALGPAALCAWRALVPLACATTQKNAPPLRPPCFVVAASSCVCAPSFSPRPPKSKTSLEPSDPKTPFSHLICSCPLLRQALSPCVVVVRSPSLSSLIFNGQPCSSAAPPSRRNPALRLGAPYSKGPQLAAASFLKEGGFGRAGAGGERTTRRQHLPTHKRRALCRPSFPCNPGPFPMLSVRPAGPLPLGHFKHTQLGKTAPQRTSLPLLCLYIVFSPPASPPHPSSCVPSPSRRRATSTAAVAIARAPKPLPRAGALCAGPAGFWAPRAGLRGCARRFGWVSSRMGVGREGTSRQPFGTGEAGCVGRAPVGYWRCAPLPCALFLRPGLREAVSCLLLLLNTLLSFPTRRERGCCCSALR